MSDPQVYSSDATADRSHTPPLAGNDLLPPVEPPNAGFIIQLFVVPAVIVLLIVAAWLSVSWLVHRTRPQDLIQGLQGTGVARWQRASELADILRNKRYAEFKRDGNAATTLAAVLTQEVNSAGSASGMTEEQIMLRFFLCRALGEFEVAEGIDALKLAAETNRDPAEQLVRRGAIQALAVRAHNARQSGAADELSGSELEQTLLRLAEDRDPIIRSEAAYALGRVDTPAVIERLELLVDDPNADARFNAAVALARKGSVKSVGVLAEMLEPAPPPSEDSPEFDNQTGAHKQATILHNAMAAAVELRAQNPQADMSPVIESLEQLAKTDSEVLERLSISRDAVSDAKRTLDMLKESQPRGGD